MRKLLFIFALFLPVLAFSQATTAYHRLNQVFARGNGVNAQIVPYATVAVTNSATGVAGVIYVDPGLTVRVPNSVVTADANGNYGYYFALETCMTEKITYPNGGMLTFVNVCSNTTAGGSVTSFSAPSGSWPSWLVPTVTSPTTTPSLAVAASAIPNSALAVQTPNTVLGAVTVATPTGLVLPSCNGTLNALTWNSGVGFGCDTIGARLTQQPNNFQSIASAIANPRLDTPLRVGNICAAPADSWSVFHYTLYSSLWLGETWGNTGPGWTNTGPYGSGPGTYTINGVTVTQTGTWTLLDGNTGASPVGPDLTAAQSSGTGGTIVWTFPVSPEFPSDLPWGSAVNEVDLYWWGQSGGGSFTYTNAAGSPVIVNTSSLTGLQVTQITGFNSSAFSNTETVTVTAAGSSGVIIFGTNGIRSGNGYRLQDLGHSGSTSGNWNSANSTTLTTGWSGLGCTTFVNMLGVNDANVGVPTDTYLSNMQALVTKELAANSAADIVFVAQPDQGEGLSTALLSYKNAIQPWALANGYVFVDLYDKWGPYAGSGGTNALGYFLSNNHPNPTGDKNIADLIDSALSAGVAQYSDNVPNLISSPTNAPINITGNAATATLAANATLATNATNAATAAYLTPTVVKNLIPNSDLKWATSSTAAYWISTGLIGANFTIGNKLGANDTNSWISSSSNSGSSVWVATVPFYLVCGQTYTLSANINALGASGANVTAGIVGTSGYAPVYGSVYLTPPASGRVSSTFTFSPAGCTAGTTNQVQLIFDTQGTTITSGQSISWSAPMLETGSVVHSYVSNVADDDSATLQPASIPVFAASLTTTSATSDSVTVTGMTSSGHCSLTATNTSAATNIATTYISAKTTNQITVTHTGASGLNYDVLCTPY